MIQFIMMVLGLAFPNNHTNTVNANPSQVAVQNNINQEEDTNGETGQIPPKK